MLFVAALDSAGAEHPTFIMVTGQPTTECTYVESTITDAPYFATKVKLSTEGE